MSPPHSKIGLRWTLGDVSDRGFEALRLSVLGAHKIFRDRARYAICVNTISLARAKNKTGDLPAEILWHDATRDIPKFLLDRFDRTMAEGVGWKLAPLRFFPDLHEISLDNDCILWNLPPTMHDWLSDGHAGRCLMAEDVKSCFGAFAHLCGPHPRNAGIRGLPPNFDFASALHRVLSHHNKPLTSETDEQGLQTAALSLHAPPLAISLKEVTICSPFHPHLPHLGECGAHFVGLNARHIPWNYFDRPADLWMTDHWHRHRPELHARVGSPISPLTIAAESALPSLHGKF